jgi:biotin transport system substrate-specific component
MAGPTGGYLLGFFAAAVITGQCAARGFDRSWPRALVTASAGMAAIFACGLIWLSMLIGVDKAIQFGAAPFALGAALKILLAMLTLPLAWKFLGRDGHGDSDGDGDGDGDGKPASNQ